MACGLVRLARALSTPTVSGGLPLPAAMPNTVPISVLSSVRQRPGETSARLSSMPKTEPPSPSRPPLGELKTVPSISAVLTPASPSRLRLSRSPKKAGPPAPLPSTARGSSASRSSAVSLVSSSTRCWFSAPPPPASPRFPSNLLPQSIIPLPLVRNASTVSTAATWALVSTSWAKASTS